MTAEDSGSASDTGAGPGTGTSADDADTRLMAQLGITRTQVDNFHVGPYRYTNLGDAVAAAKRQREKQ